VTSNRRRLLRRTFLVLVCATVAGLGLMVSRAEAQMDIKQASGVPLPDNSLPAGTVSVRVVRDSFANNLAGVDVVFTIDGASRTVKTNESGRALVNGLKPGARVQATAIVDGQRLQSQEISVGSTATRFVLVASGSGASASAPASATAATPTGPFAAAAGTAVGQMDLKQASGIPLPDNSLPAGTVSVRVVRDSFANNLSGVDVVFSIDGTLKTVKTNESGRAQIDGLKPGAHLKASAVVGSERLESQEVTLADTAIRFVLVASGGGGTPSAAAASGPAVPGRVIIGPQSRIVADYSDERLNIYYALQIVNGSTSPVDIGGPLSIKLPAEARGAGMMEASTPQAKVAGSRVTVLGPFPPGVTSVNVAFELPYSGPTAHLEQRWPVEAQPFGIFVLKTGDLDLSSAQLSTKQASVQQGQPLVMGLLAQVPEGQPLIVDITGLPHYPLWPRNLALGSAGTIALIGLWAAFGPASRRRRA
jgi:hypothetical protein